VMIHTWERARRLFRRVGRLALHQEDLSRNCQMVVIFPADRRS